MVGNDAKRNRIRLMDEKTFRALLNRVSDTVIEDMVADGTELTAQNYTALLEKRFENFRELIG